MKWFSNNIRTTEELRREYRKLMKENHPDVGGTEEAAKEINAEYDRLYAILSRQEAQERPQGPRTKPPRIRLLGPFWTLW